MERLSLRSRRRALARAALTGLAVAATLPAAALADKPASAGNGPPGPAGNPHHPHQPAATGRGHQHATPPPRSNGRAVRAHGSPPPRHVSSHPSRPAAPPPPRHHAAPPSHAPRGHAFGRTRGSQGEHARGPHGNNGAAHQKTTICHATGSATNPYVEITISDRALKAHARHQDGRDIIPAPAGGCPGAAVSKQAAATPGSVVAQLVESLVAAVTSPNAGARETVPRTVANRRGEAHVLGVSKTSAAPGSSPGGATRGRPLASLRSLSGHDTAKRDDRGSLPFTGVELALILLAAVGLLLAGFAVRRAAGARKTAP